jgi:hypothetical protein
MIKDEGQGFEDGATSITPESKEETQTSRLPDPEKAVDPTADEAKPADAEYEYITGIKLLLTMASITLVCFLMTLDMSIIVTVSQWFLSMP